VILGRSSGLHIETDTRHGPKKKVRVLGGFAVPYFETIWAEESGTMVVFGTEGAVVAALWFISVPVLFVFGKTIREHFSIKAKAL
jgi:hypothetical protein